ncbi:MAG: aquaporin [Verrucomicrobiota bacterium]
MKKYLSEFFGAFILVFAGCGAIVVNELYGGALSHVGVALVWGMVVMVLIYSLGDVSGAHFNPAVTIGFIVAGRTKAYKTLANYIVWQVLGALAAAYLLKLLFPLSETLGATLPADSVWRAFAMEVVLTFILFFVIMQTTTGAKEKGIMAGVAIGSAVGIDAMFGGPVSGASMNPARSIGPAIASGHIEHLWVYIAAPLLGALLAAPSCLLLRGRECCISEDDLSEEGCKEKEKSNG